MGLGAGWGLGDRMGVEAGLRGREPGGRMGMEAG